MELLCKIFRMGFGLCNKMCFSHPLRRLYTKSHVRKLIPSNASKGLMAPVQTAAKKERKKKTCLV